MTTKRTRTAGSMAFDTINYTAFAAFSIIMLYPMWEVLVVSFMPALEAMNPGIKLFPRKFVLGPYRLIFDSRMIGYGYFNTVYRTLIGTALSVFFTFCTAYPLANRKLPARSFFTIFYLIPMFFSGGLIPTYLLVRGLGMLNTRWALIFPSLLGTFNILIMRNFIMTIPDSLEESAMIDGAPFYLILIRIIIPLSIPILATIGLWVAVWHWNSWFDALIYIQDNTKVVLQKILRFILIEEELSSMDMGLDEVLGQEAITPRSIKAATIVVSIGPIVLAYPFIQKYFVKGIMIGSLKG